MYDGRLSRVIEKNVNWDKLKSFYNVVIAGGITAAAKRMRVSQPAISRQISLLEHQLKEKLFYRTGAKGVQLTKHGKILFHSVKQMKFCFDKTFSKENTLENSSKNCLKIAANRGVVDTWLMNFIPEFVKKNEDIRLSIHSTDGEMTLDSGDTNVLLTPYIKDNTDLVQDHLMSWHRKLYAHPSYIERFGMPTCVEDLTNHHLISFGGKNIFLFENINWHLSLGCPEGKPRKARMSVNNSRSIFEMANAGLGIISYTKESPLLKNSELLPVLPSITGSKLDIFYAYRKSNISKEVIQLFGDYLKEKVLSSF